MKLLIVDDFPANLKLLRAALEAEGHRVIEASNGREALDLLEKDPAEAVISDVLMPAMDGFRFCYELRKNPVFASIPVVLYTATYNSPADRSLATSVGANAYILKPAPIKTLLEALHEAKLQSQQHVRPQAPEFDESDVLERYNAALVRKLESRNSELQRTFANLSEAHEAILELNRNLETRVAQRTAALDSANRELETFSYSVSHDLRAPLRHLRGFAELLEQCNAATFESEGKEFVKHILTAAQRMDQLILDLLELARSAREPLEMADLDLENVLEEAVQLVAPEAQGRNIVWLRSRLPNVLGDARLLRQVFVNLLSNAIKFTRPRTSAAIEIGHRAGRTEEAVIFVRDNGVGFDSSRANELFGVFKRFHSAQEFEGTGIGLAHASRIIARHGGSMWAEAESNRGATFYFSLRRSTPQAPH
jgi:signal transduction histidine kinase